MKWYFKVLKQYFDFKGRAGRKEYWLFFLFNIIISISLSLLASEYKYSILPLVYLAYMALLLIPSIAVAVRRMHDVGKSGWFILVPIYNFILAITNGETGENQYGQDPKTR
jgi:uncharacterized membrane protein YhaH (DUF805 family)